MSKKDIMDYIGIILKKVPMPHSGVLSSIVDVAKAVLNDDNVKKIKKAASKVTGKTLDFIDKNITHKSEIRNIQNENIELQVLNDKLEKKVKDNWKGLKKFDNEMDYLKEEMTIAADLEKHMDSGFDKKMIPKNKELSANTERNE